MGSHRRSNSASITPPEADDPSPHSDFKTLAGEVILIGERPPPTDGMTTITGVVTALLAEESPNFRVAPMRTGLRRGIGPLSRLTRQLALIQPIFKLKRYRRQGKRTIYAPSDSGLGLLRVLLLVAAARRVGMVTVLHHHAFRYIQSKSLLMTAICTVGGDRLAHFVLCEGMEERFLQLYPQAAGRTVVLSNGPLVSRLIESATPTSKGGAEGKDTGGYTACDHRPYVVGMLGNITLAKGFDVVLRAAAELATRGDYLFRVAGPLDSDCIGLLRALKGDRARPEILGPVYGMAKRDFLRSLDVLVFPSSYVNEAEPLVIWEAQLQGVPVVAYRRGCISDQISVGAVVDDYRSLVEAIETQPWKRNRMGTTPTTESPTDALERAFREAIRSTADLA